MTLMKARSAGAAIAEARARRFVLAIDPGTDQSAWLGFDGQSVRGHGIVDNAELLRLIRSREIVRELLGGTLDTTVVIEQMRSFMQRVGREVFETVRWAGRFEEAAHPMRVVLLGRKDVVLHLCGSARGNDADVRAAVAERFGGSAAKGTKTAPGPLYGVARDVWSALALAVTWTDEEAKP